MMLFISVFTFTANFYSVNAESSLPQDAGDADIIRKYTGKIENYYENCKVKMTVFIYFEENKPYQCVFVPKDKKYIDFTGDLYKVKKNVYRYKQPDGTITFKFSKNKVKVVQKGDILRGIKYNGTFKLKKK